MLYLMRGELHTHVMGAAPFAPATGLHSETVLVADLAAWAAELPQFSTLQDQLGYGNRPGLQTVGCLQPLARETPARITVAGSS